MDCRGLVRAFFVVLSVVVARRRVFFSRAVKLALTTLKLQQFTTVDDVYLEEIVADLEAKPVDQKIVSTTCRIVCCGRYGVTLTLRTRKLFYQC